MTAGTTAARENDIITRSCPGTGDEIRGVSTLAVALGTVIVRGYLLWWQRRPTRGSRRPARPPLRGTWRRLHPVTVVAVVAAAVTVGWFAPLLGLSLLAFLLVDVAVGLLQRRRSPEHSPEGTSVTG